MSFPFVTIPDFAYHGNHNNRLSKVLQVSFAPLITRSQVNKWQDYAIQNQGWIAESLAFHDLGDGQHRATNSSARLDSISLRPISPYLYHFEEYTSGKALIQTDEGAQFGPGNYAPVWQQAPAPRDASIVNFDLLSHPAFARIFHGAWDSGHSVLSDAMPLDFLYRGAVPRDEEQDMHPHSFILDPVFRALNDVAKVRDNDIVGFLVGVIGWEIFFSGILNDGSNGVIVVVRNTCGNKFTYCIEGPRAVFLGNDDLHDHKYNHLVKTAPFAKFLQVNASDVYDHCEYDLAIYPSRAMEDQFASNKPLLYSTAVVLIFLGTTFVFLMFDFAVAIRQRRVAAKARRADALVSSLFPSNVREQLLKDADDHIQREEDAQKKLRLRLTASMSSTFSGTNGSMAHAKNSRPIADLFPNTTVMVRSKCVG
jgi:CHASE domain